MKNLFIDFNKNIVSFSYDSWTVKVLPFTGEYHLYIEDDYFGIININEAISYYLDQEVEFNQNLINFFGEIKGKEVLYMIGRCFNILEHGLHLYAKELIHIYGIDVAEYLIKSIEKIIEKRKAEYVDNYRFAIKGNPQQEALYASLAKRGCCGYIDEVVECPIDGNTYLVGCNFGH